MSPYIEEERILKKGSACGMTEQAVHSFYLNRQKEGGHEAYAAGLTGNVWGYRKKPITGLLFLLLLYIALTLVLHFGGRS